VRCELCGSPVSLPSSGRQEAPGGPRAPKGAGGELRPVRPGAPSSSDSWAAGEIAAPEGCGEARGQARIRDLPPPGPSVALLKRHLVPLAVAVLGGVALGSGLAAFALGGRHLGAPRASASARLEGDLAERPWAAVPPRPGVQRSQDVDVTAPKDVLARGSGRGRSAPGTGGSRLARQRVSLPAAGGPSGGVSEPVALSSEDLLAPR